MQPALKNGRNVWDPVNMPEREFEMRLERIRAQMKKKAIDLLILYGRGLTDYADPAYVSNFVIRLPRGTIALVPLEGAPVLFFEGASRGLPSLLATTCIKNLKAAGNVAKECVTYLKEKELIPSSVGLGRLSEQMPYQEFKVLKDALSGCNVLNASTLVPNLRMIKSERECDEIRRAGRIVRKCFDMAASLCSMGMTDQFLEAMLRKQARLDGAEDVRILFAISNAKAHLRPPENKPIGAGSVFTLYVAAAFERYWAEGIRTYAAGENSLSALASDLPSAFARALQSVRCGIAVSEVNNTMKEAATQSGFDLLDTYALGNGIGLSLNELPLIAPKGRQRLTEGMCMAMRLPVRDKTFGSIMVGDTLIVTKRGIELVT